MQGANAQYNAALDRSNISNASDNSMLQGGVGLASAGMMMF